MSASPPAHWRLEPDVDPAAVGMDPARLDRIARLFAETLERGTLCHGAQLALHRGGRRVLDVGGGIARERTGVPVRPDTLFVVFSATKGLAALAMWRLQERGALDFDAPVCRYWPEFARAVPHKSEVSVRHVMSHRGGFPIGPEWLTPRHWTERAALARAMEEVPLRWRPGEQNGYHPMNFGHVIGELILRLDGRDCGRLLHDEVFAPLGLRDLHLGLPADPALEERVAWISARALARSAAEAAGVAAAAGEAQDAPAEPPPAAATSGGDYPPPGFSAAALPQEIPERYRDTPELAHPLNRPEIHRAVLPAAGAVATARDLSALYAVLALGGREGARELLRPESLREATTPTNRRGDIDQTLRLPIRWGTGWHLGSFGRGSTLRTFGHGGAGGQLAFADPERALSFAFVTTGERDREHLAWRMEMQRLAWSACRD